MTITIIYIIITFISLMISFLEDTVNFVFFFLRQRRKLSSGKEYLPFIRRFIRCSVTCSVIYYNHHNHHHHHQGLGHLLAANLEDEGGVLDCVALVGGDQVGGVVAAVHGDARHVAAAVQRHHGLVGHEHGGHAQALHQDLRHPRLVLRAGQRHLRDQHGLGGGLGLQLLLHDVGPDGLQVLPALHHALRTRSVT